MLKKFMPFALVATCTVAGAAVAQPRPAGDPTSAPVAVSITMRNDDTLEVSYRIPESCQALVFANPGLTQQAAIRMRGQWSAADECTTLDFQSIRPRHATCRVLRLRIPTQPAESSNRPYDGGPAPAQPFGDGVYLHTGAYTVNDTCGPVEWHAAAPGGTVSADGSVAGETLSYKIGDVTAALRGVPMLLLPTAPRPGSPPLHADSGIDVATRALLTRTLGQAQESLRTMLPALPLERGQILVKSSNSAISLTSKKISTHVQVLQLPSAPLPDLETQARMLIAHETAHRAQGRRWNEAWQEDLQAIQEGGAEFLRLAASFQANWLSRDALKDQMEAALNGCSVAMGNKNWKEFRQRNTSPMTYSCGLTLHLLGLARPDDRPVALQRIQDYYRETRTGVPTNFGHAIECGANPGCTAQRLTRLLGKDPLVAILQDEAATPNSLMHAQPGWGPALVEVMVYRHLAQLLKEDCRPGATLSHGRRAARVAPGARCSSLRSGMAPTSAEGIPLFEGIHAVRSSVRACYQRGITVLGLDNGERVQVACGTSIDLPDQVWGVDVEKATELLTGSSSSAAALYQRPPGSP